MGDIAVLLPAAGKSSRFGGSEKKIFAPLAGSVVWQHAAERLRQCQDVARLLIAIDPSDTDRWNGDQQPAVQRLGVELLKGGQERTDSVRAALERVASDEAIGFVAIHDAARPCISLDAVQAVFAAARQDGAALLARPVAGTVKRQRPDGSICTVDRRHLWEAQTPQVFRKQVLLDAYGRWRGRGATDDAQLVEWLGAPVTLVMGEATNLKITTADDLAIAEAIFAQRAKKQES